MTLNLNDHPTVRRQRQRPRLTTTWLAVLNGERSVLASLLLRRIRVRGPLRLLRDFRRCFPS